MRVLIREATDETMKVLEVIEASYDEGLEELYLSTASDDFLVKDVRKVHAESLMTSLFHEGKVDMTHLRVYYDDDDEMQENQ